MKILNKKDYEKLQNEIDDISIDLHGDIVETGIKDMLNTISTIVKYQQRVEGIKSDAEWNKVILRNLRDTLKQKYEAREENYLSTDKEVQKQSSRELRYAKAHSKKDMKKLKKKLETVKRKYNKAKAFANIVNQKYEFLEGMYSKISRQLSGLKHAWMMGDISHGEIEKMIKEVVEKKNTGEVTKGGKEL